VSCAAPAAGNVPWVGGKGGLGGGAGGYSKQRSAVAAVATLQQLVSDHTLHASSQHQAVKTATEAVHTAQHYRKCLSGSDSLVLTVQ
jgi:hypothetical protein